MLLEDFSRGSPFNCLTHVSTVCFSSGYNVFIALANPNVNPSGPGDLPAWKENNVDLISSFVDCCTSHSLSINFSLMDDFGMHNLLSEDMEPSWISNLEFLLPN